MKQYVPCGCDPPMNYVEDMCLAHQDEYEMYCLETAPEDIMSVQHWWNHTNR